jgi:hypothetical protein
MILGTLRTHILEDHDTGEGGFFSLEVTIDEGLMQRSGDVKAFAFRQVAVFLSSAVLDTGVSRDRWTFEFEDRPRRRYSFPEFLDFGGRS